MADIFYVESGYAENDGYAVKTADASIVQTRTAKTITVTGNVALSSTQYKFARSSMVFDGSGDYLTVTPESSFRTGTNDFTAEAWFYPTATGKTHRIFYKGTTATNSIRLSGNSSQQFSCIIGDVTISGGTLTANTWHHLAAVRSGNNVYLYVNGTRVASGSTTVNINNTDPMIIGGSHLTAGESAQGYIDELRFVNTALYTGATLTVPTQPFFNNSLTELLIHGDSPSIADDAGGTGINAQATLSTSPTNAQFGVATLNATASISSTITVVSPVFGTATLNTIASLETTVNKIKTTSSTLESQSNVNSQSEVIRNFSATLDCQATTQSSAERTRTNSATLSAVAGVSSSGGSLLIGSATLNAITSLQADILRTRASASLLASAGSLSANANAIKRIGQITNIPGSNGATTGIHATTSTVSIWNPSGIFTINPGTAISFWAKKDTVSNNNGVFVNLNKYSAPYVSGLTIELKSDRLQFRARYYTDDNPVNETTLEWTDLDDNIVVDTQWHHYFFYVEIWTEQAGGREYKVRLYQDGIDLGTVSEFYPDNINPYISGPFNIGFEKTWNSSTNVFEITDTTKILNGCVAQLWIDDDVSSSYSISSWYNNGYVNTLPTGQRFYSAFNWPYDSNTTYYYVSGTTLTQANLNYEWLCNQNGIKFLDSTASLSSLAGLLKSGTATLSAQASISCDADKNIIGSSTLTAQSSISINADVIGGGVAPMMVTASLSARGDATYNQSATLSAQASISKADSTYAIFGSGQLNSTSSMRVVTGNEATLVVTSTLTVDPTYSYNSRATLSATATIDAIGTAGKFAVAHLNAEFSIAAKLTIVPIPDDLTTLFVSAESRGLRVLPETRFATVELESNLNRILMETRDLAVPYESRQLREAVDPAIEETLARIRRIPA